MSCFRTKFPACGTLACVQPPPLLKQNRGERPSPRFCLRGGVGCTQASGTRNQTVVAFCMKQCCCNFSPPRTYSVCLKLWQRSSEHLSRKESYEISKMLFLFRFLGLLRSCSHHIYIFSTYPRELVSPGLKLNHHFRFFASDS